MALLAARTEAWLGTAVRVTGVLTLVAMAIASVLAAHFAPVLPDCDDFTTAAPGNCQASPHAQKLFYFHVPVALAAYVAFIGLAFASYRFLVRHDRAWDAFAAAAAEVGVLFSGLTLLSGSVWARAEWGVWWRNEDTKLVLTLIMFLVYVGYLVLRRQIDDPRRRGRVGAVYALLSFATVPLSYVAQRVWKSQHPTVFDPGDPTSGIVTPWISETFTVSVIAYILLAAFFILVRYRLEVQRIDAADATAGGGPDA